MMNEEVLERIASQISRPNSLSSISK